MTNCSSQDSITIVKNTTNLIPIINEIIHLSDTDNSFYICDITEIINKYQLFRKLLPKVRPHYAVKCNDYPPVLKTLNALGASFDCASHHEIKCILELGVEPSRIIFANSMKQPQHIKFARNVNVDLMTFDSEFELSKIKENFPTARILIRIRCDDWTSVIPLGKKFGCDALNDAPHLLRVAYKLQLNVIGVCFHIGTGSRNPKIFGKAIELSRGVFDSAKSIGFNFTVLDLGGGFAGELDDAAHCINSALDKYFDDLQIDIIAEPGRYLVASAFTLCCKINLSKHYKELNTMVYYINDSVFKNFNAVIMEKRILNPSPLKIHDGATYNTVIWGETCCSGDQIVKNALLPKMNKGDWLVFYEMGAYSYVLQTKFNGFPCSNVYSIINENTWNLLKGEKPFIAYDFVTNGLSQMR